MSEEENSRDTEDGDGKALAQKLGVRPEKVFDKLEDESQSGDMPPPLRFLEQYMPEKEDWATKGRLDRNNMVINISSLRVLKRLYPEIGDEMDEILQEWLDHVEKRLVSVEGQSRQEYKEILQSLLAGMHHKTTSSEDYMSEDFMDKLFRVDKGEDK